MRMRVDLDGAAVAVAVHGAAPSSNRPAILFLHGAGMDRSVWALQAPRLGGRGLTALVPDLPGHGHSSGQPLPSIEALATCVWRLVDALGLTRLALVGHSMGALA